MADRKISALSALLGANVAKNSDRIPILDVSEADADKNKTILVSELRAALFSGCRARKAANQTTANYSGHAAVAFDGTDDYDTDAYHDPSSNNTRVTVPAGLNITKVRITGCLLANLVASGSIAALYIKKNGTDFIPLQSWGNGTLTDIYAHGSIVDSCVAGDYYELWFFCGDTSITVVAASTFLAIEAVG